MILSKSPRLFMERKGLVPTWRTPTPQFRTNNPVHEYPVSYPLPAVRFQQPLTPDRLATPFWPNGGPPSP